MPGVLGLLLGIGKPPADITVTCGNGNTGLPPPDDSEWAGYSQFLGVGSRSPASYTDNLGNTRTVAECHNIAGSTFATTFTFGIDGTGVPNNNNTFRQLVVNGTVLERSAATYDSSENGDTWWQWTTPIPTIPGSGDITLTVRF